MQYKHGDCTTGHRNPALAQVLNTWSLLVHATFLLQLMLSCALSPLPSHAKKDTFAYPQQKVSFASALPTSCEPSHTIWSYLMCYILRASSWELTGNHFC